MAKDILQKASVRCGLGCVAAASVLFLSAWTWAQGSQPDGKQERIKTLINQLASPNRAPTRGRGDDAKLPIPSTYGRRTQQKVLDAWKALLDEGLEAFPLLIANSKDNRYSCTRAGGNGDVNLTVGSVCRAIVENQVEVYHDAIDLPWPGAEPRGYLLFQDLAAWFKERQTRTLRELQIEATEHALSALKSPSDDEKHLRERGGVAERQAKNIQRLEVFLERLKSSDQPIRPANIEGSYGTMIGLPDGRDRGGASHPYDASPAVPGKP
jgi:hypothetical protein